MNFKEAKNILLQIKKSIKENVKKEEIDNLLNKFEDAVNKIEFENDLKQLQEILKGELKRVQNVDVIKVNKTTEQKNIIMDLKPEEFKNVINADMKKLCEYYIIFYQPPKKEEKGEKEEKNEIEHKIEETNNLFLALLKFNKEQKKR